MEPAVGIIADDFTGALLVASVFEGDGIAAPVALDPAALGPEEAAGLLILGTRLRVAPVEQASVEIRKAAQALAAAGCRRIAYKACASFDSTAEGNIGLAARLLSGHAGGAPVLLSAGFPEFDSTVHQGYLFYRKRLVSESVKRFDPLTPMTDPDLLRFLSQQTGTPLHLLSHRWLTQGLGSAQAEWQRLLAEGARYVLADTSDDNDAEVTAALAVAQDAVLVASDPAILAYGRRLAAAGTRGAGYDGVAVPDGPGAVLIGSVGPTASAQAAAFASRHPLIRIDIADPRDETELVRVALDAAGGEIGRQPVGFATLGDPAAVYSAQARFGVAGAAQRAEKVLSGIASALVAGGVRRLVVSGGETSGAVVAALGIRRLRALPPGPAGAGFCIAQAPVPISLFLKSGKLGADDALLVALDHMQSSGFVPR